MAYQNRFLLHGITVKEEKPFHAGAMVRMKVGKHDMAYAVDVQRKADFLGSLSQHFSNGMRTIDQQPLPFEPHEQTRSIVKGRKRIADAKYKKP
jgi:hypothetical protein